MPPTEVIGGLPPTLFAKQVAEKIITGGRWPVSSPLITDHY